MKPAEQEQSQSHFTPNGQSVSLGIEPLATFKLMSSNQLSVIRRATSLTRMPVCPSSEQQQRISEP